MALDPIDRALVRLIRAALPVQLESGVADPSPIPWDAVLERAGLARMAPLLYLALRSADPSRQPPPSAAGRLRSEYLQATLANTIICRECARLLERCRQARIPIVLLKGVALANSLYPDSAARALGDIDVLVHAEDLARMRDLILDSGYTVRPDLSEKFRDEFESAQTYVRTAEPSLVVDVHRHLFNVPYFRESIALDWFWDSTTPVRVEGQEGLMFGPTAQLLHLSGHYAFHHQTEGLRWLYDLVLLVVRHDAEISWAQALATARRFGLSRAVQYALADMGEVWGVPLSAEAQLALRQHRPSWRERLAFAAITAPQNRARILWDSWSMPGRRGGLAYLGRSMFPETSYMMQRYKIADRRLLPLFYVWRLLYGAWLLLASVGSMLGSIGRLLGRAVFSRPDSKGGGR